MGKKKREEIKIKNIENFFITDVLKDVRKRMQREKSKKEKER